MIQNIIFDFGNVLIPIEPRRTEKAFTQLGASPSLWEQTELFQKLEIGQIEPKAFLTAIQPHFFRKTILTRDIRAAWNALLDPLPEENIQLLKKYRPNYRLFLLSNTNALHIDHIRETAGPFLYRQFYRQFEKVYYSQEVGLRKPEADMYRKVLEENQLKPEETLFIDDKTENTVAAEALGISVWHLKTGREKISDLGKVLSAHH